MKRISFSLVAVVLFVFIGNAQNERILNTKHEFKCGSIVVSYNKEITEYNYGSLDELKEGIEEIVREFDFNDLENEKENCKVVIEVKLELAIENVTIVMSESIRTNSKLVTEDAKQLKTILIAALD